MKIIAGILGGIILALFGGFVFSLAFVAGSPDKMSGLGGASSIIFLIVGVLIGIFAPNASKAWRRIFLTLAVLSFLLPLASLIFTGTVVSTVADSAGEEAAMQAAGAALSGSVFSGLMGFIGFFLGIVFLIVGLLIGRDKKIVYVQTTEQLVDGIRTPPNPGNWPQC